MSTTIVFLVTTYPVLVTFDTNEQRLSGRCSLALAGGLVRSRA